MVHRGGAGRIAVMHQYPTYAREDAAQPWEPGHMVSIGTGMRIVWQEGTFVGTGLNGSMPEQPVRALIHRIEDLQARLPCKQNLEILSHLNQILGLFDERTKERSARGVLGTGSP
jgi:hypothetical protein